MAGPLIASAAARLVRWGPLIQCCAATAAAAQQSAAAHVLGSPSEGQRWGVAHALATALALGAAAAPVAAAAEQAQQQSVPPSGAPAALTEEGLTNHPLDYDPITNEHTARMTLAKKAAMEAYQAGRYKEAERRFLEALQEAEQGFPPGDPHVPSARNNLAEFYRNMGRLDEAQRLYEQALNDLQEHLGEKHWLYASALVNLAMLHETKGDLQKALKSFEHALAVRAKLFSTNSYVYADTAFSLARVLVKLGGRKEQQRALELMRTAVRIVEDSGNVEGTPIIQWLLGLAELQRSMGQPQDAADTLRRGLKHMEQQHGDLTAQASEVNERLADALSAAGNAAAARDTMRRCVDARTHVFGHHLVVAASMTRLAALELGPPQQPDAAQRAEHYAGSAVAIANEALQQARQRGGGGWLPRRLVGWMGGGGNQGAGNGGQQEAGVERLRAALELARAYQVLAQAKQHSSQQDAQRSRAEAEAALRAGVGVLREAQAAGAQDLQELSARLGDQSPAVEKASSLLVDVKLLLLELLDALAAMLRTQQGQQQHAPVIKGTPLKGREAEVTPEEVHVLLLESELLAAELYGD